MAGVFSLPPHVPPGIAGPIEQFRLAHPIFFSGLLGLASGFINSIPVGPVNLTILNEGARRGFQWAMLIGLGATFMDLIYCFLAFTSLGSFFSGEYVRAGMELLSFVFMLFLGIKFLLAKTVRATVKFGAATDKIEKQIEGHLRPHSAFMTGFVRVLGNVGVLVFWVVFASAFISRGWVLPDWPSKLACVGGVALGTGLWFLALSCGAARGHGRFSEKTLLRMEHLSGICLLLLAAFYGFKIVSEIRTHRHNAEAQRIEMRVGGDDQPGRD